MSKKAPEEIVVAKAIEAHIQIVWDIPESIVTRYANNILVQTVEDVFKISFFEMKPQPYFGGKLPTEVKAVCIGSVIVSPQKMSKFIDAMKSQLDKYNDKDGEELRLSP